MFSALLLRRERGRERLTKVRENVDIPNYEIGAHVCVDIYVYNLFNELCLSQRIIQVSLENKKNQETTCGR